MKSAPRATNPATLANAASAAKSATQESTRFAGCFWYAVGLDSTGGMLFPFPAGHDTAGDTTGGIAR